MKVGDTVYSFDRNRRIYKTGEGVAPDYRYYFRETVITGETPTQWLTLHGAKFNKRPRAGRIPDTFSSHHDRLYTGGDVDNAVYVTENRHRVAEAIREVDDAEVLRQIEVLLGDSK